MIHDVRGLLTATEGSLVLGQPTTRFNKVSIDTRTLQAGDIFFALKGPRFDGHDFVRTAADRGACVVVIDTLDERIRFSEPHPADVVQVRDVLTALQRFGAACRARSAAHVVGVTGSNGKTTTKEMLASILRLAGKTLATRGNLNNHIGLPLMCTRLEPEHQFAVLELGTSKPGDMATLLTIARPEIGLMTNVGKDHLEFFGTAEGVLRENQILFDTLPAGGTAVINLDDPLLAAVPETEAHARVTFSIERSDATVSASAIEPWPLPIRFELKVAGETRPAQLRSPGSFQISNALGAAAVAHRLGVGIDQIVEGLASFTPAAMRMQVFELPRGSVLINDAYNANPSSVKASVESFASTYTDRPHWVVLGDMRELGSIARDEHRALGEWLGHQKIDRVFLYGRDTRFILESLLVTDKAQRVERHRKKSALIKSLRRHLEGDAVAVLFKGSRSLALETVIQGLLPVNSPVTLH